MNKRALLIFPYLLFLLSPASGEWSEPVNLGPNVNTSWFEYYPSISADGTKLYFAAADRPTGYGQDDIWISTWEDTMWGPAVNAGPNVNSIGADLTPSISADGLELYFINYGRPGGYGLWDIWVSTWQDTMWGPAVNAGPNVNTAYIEWSVGTSFGREKLYFASDRPGTRGDTDIWVCEWDSANNEWGPAINLGPNVNTFSREYCPSVSSDDSQLYFARWGTASELVDIYVSEWQDTMWGPAVNLGDPVNTSTWDDGPSISSDGTKLYFASSRDTGDPAVQDIWVSEWLPGLQERQELGRRSHGAELLANEPNPFASSTLIRFSVPKSASVDLRLYDIAGRLVKTLVMGAVNAGDYQVFWNGRNEEGSEVTSGVYFYRLVSGDFEQTQKAVLVR